MSAPLDVGRIQSELATRAVPLGHPLVVVSTTASTNDDAKGAAQTGAPHGAAFLAEAQTMGRGRLGRSWHSPTGENLYASFLLRPALDAATAPLVTFAAGLAVADAIAPLLPANVVALKWPNDVFVDGRKVAGILCEAHWADGHAAWIVVGIGLNVRTRTFPDEIAHRATSLELAGGRAVSRELLFVALASALSSRIATLSGGDLKGIVRDFMARDALVGRPITIDGSPAHALGIADDGSLRVRRPDGTCATIAAGDVQIRGESLPE